MSYTVLARKWRPLVFEDVVAQKHITSTLENAIRSGRIAHAFLFSGPRGIGKTTVTRILAKALNCEHGPTPTPCNQCRFCKGITEGSSLDVLEIDGASNRGIDEIRELREATRYAPTESRYKVYIIDEVHMLTEHAFNALLKTLEEPPRNVVFIFATTEPQKVPATILSRCQRFDFRRIPTDDIVEHLAGIARRDGIRIDGSALVQIAQRAEGAMRDALSLLDQVASFGGDSITSDVVRDVLGLVDLEVLFGLLDAVAEKDAKKALQIVDHMIDAGGDIKEFLFELTECLRTGLLLRISGKDEAGALGVPRDYLDRYVQLSERFAEEDLMRMIKVVSDLEFVIERTAQPRLRLEMAVVRLAKLDATVAVADLLERLRRLEPEPGGDAGEGPRQRAGATEPPVGAGESKSPLAAAAEEPTGAGALLGREATPQYASGAAEDPLPKKLPGTLEAVSAHWHEVVEKAGLQSVSLAAFLAQGLPTEVRDGCVTLSFKPDNGFHIGAICKNRRLVEGILEALFEKVTRIDCVLQEANGAPDNGVLDIVFVKEPIIKTLVDTFDGELVIG